MKDLQQRDDAPEGYYNATIDGRLYSVVDFGTTMASHPTIKELRAAGLFLGWEAIEIINGELSGGAIRANTWKDLWNTISTNA